MKDLGFNEDAYLKYLESLNNPSLEYNISNENSAFNFVLSYPENTHFYNYIELYKNIEYLSENSCESDYFKSALLDTKSKLVERLIKMLDVYFNNFDFHIDSYDVNKKVESGLSYLQFVAEIVYNYSNRHKSFSNIFTENNGIFVLFEFINHKKLVSIICNNSDDSDENENVKDILTKCYRRLLGSIYNISNQAIKYLNIWKSLNAVERLLVVSKFSINIEQLSDFHFVSYLTIANIFEDNDLVKLESLKPVVQEICKYIIIISLSIDENKQIQRQYLKVYQTDNQIYECAFIVDKAQTIWSLIDLLFGLYRLSVNDSIKKFIYNECNMKQHIKNLILNGNQVEKDFSLKLLWQLCFDKSIISDVRNDTTLVTYLNQLKNDKEIFKRLVTKCNGILWLISKASQAKEIKSTEKHEHIMISYNRNNRDLCLKIKTELEKTGHKIWIDIQNISGSSLDSMAQGIEKSKCVLICMTEKYKQSAYCRAEAEYAFQLNKPIIPLIMQQAYKPDGWLGFILGSKIFINFTKYSFDECMKRLYKELEPFCKINNNKQEGIKINNKKSDNWSQEEAQNWLKEKQFNELIIKNINPCDGALLKQYYNMYKTVPEFFYSSLNINGIVSLHDTAFFVNELIKLFES